MSLSISQNIPAVSLSENPMIIEVESNSYKKQIGSFEVIRIILDINQCDNNDTFSITIDGEEIELTAKNNPSINGYEFSSVNDTLNLPIVITQATYSTHVSSQLKKNYTLNSLFEITTTLVGADTAIVFTAREKESISVEIDNGTCLSNSQIYIEGSEDLTYDFYKLICQVLFQDLNGRWQIEGEDRLPVNEEGKAMFNLESYFADKISGNFTFPESSDSVLIVDTANFVKQYKYRYAEIGVKSGDTLPRIYNLNESATLRAIKGGVSEYKLREYAEDDTDFWSQLQYNLMFLTWQPKRKSISAYQTEKLFFLVYTTVTEVNYKIKAYYDGGTTTFTRATESASIYNTIEIVCSPAKIDFPTYVPGLEITKYEVWIENQDNVRISEIFYYTIDYVKHPYQKEFIYRNSLGAYECMRCIGLSQKDVQFDRILFDTKKDFDFYYKKFNSKQLINEELELYVANTGLISRRYVEHLRELHFSEEVYEIANNYLFPIVITNKKMFLQKDSEYLYNMEITYARAYTNKHFTPDPSIKKDDYHYAEPYLNESFSDDFIIN